MKVLFIAHDSYAGGSGKCLLEFLSQLKPEDGIDPVVLTRNNNDLKAAFVENGFETYSCRFGSTMSSSKSSKFFWGWIYRPIMNFIAYHYLKYVVDLKTIDVIYSNSKVIDFGAFLHRKTNIPHIWHLREFGDVDFNLQSFEPNLHQYIRANATKAIAVSKAIKYHFEKDVHDKDFVSCIYDGVKTSDYIVSNGNCVDNFLNICFVGTLCEAKGQVVAIEALHALSKEYTSKIKLSFYGKGPDEVLLKKMVDRYELNECVFFKGFCPNIAEEIVKYDVGLNLSKSEGFGRTTVEYILSGLYVVGADSGATEELLEGTSCGTVVKVGNALDLSRVFVDMINNKPMYKNKALLGRQYALQNFSIERNYKKIVKILKSVCC